MIDINFDANELANKIGDGLAIMGDKLGTSTTQVFEVGSRWEVAQGYAWFVFWGLWLLIAIFFFFVGIGLALKGASAAEKVETEDAESALAGVAITGIIGIVISVLMGFCFSFASGGSGYSKNDGMNGALGRIIAPEAALVIDAFEAIENKLQ